MPWTRTNPRLGFTLILAISLLVTAIIIALPAIAQDPQYHQFVDQRRLLGIPNFWNVTSNLPYLLVGVYGLVLLAKGSSLKLHSALHPAYWIFFVSVALVGLGSAYYHLAPGHMTLVWDRLPMATAFMALFSFIWGEFINAQQARRMLWPLLATGMASVVYWIYTEQLQQGDLRLYILVQFLPLLLIPVILLCFKAAFTHTAVYIGLLAAYLVAKICEQLDAAIYTDYALLSGHTLKHIVSALGVWLLIEVFKKREQIVD